MGKGAIFSKPAAQRIVRAVREWEGQGADVGGGGSKAIRLNFAKLGFWARITGHTSAGDNQWTYSFEEIHKDTAGYGGWEAVTDGKTGMDTAYNSIEDINASTGTQGNGIVIANLPAGFTIQPCPDGTVVRMYEVYLTDSTIEYWFSYENGIDGTCE